VAWPGVVWHAQHRTPYHTRPRHSLCTTLITPHHNDNDNDNDNCSYMTLMTSRYNYNSTSTTLPLQRHHSNVVATATARLPHTTLSVRWLLQPTPTTFFRPSVNSLSHPCLTATYLSYSVLYLKFPPPLCAVLLVPMLYICKVETKDMSYIWKKNIHINMSNVWERSVTHISSICQAYVEHM